MSGGSFTIRSNASWVMITRDLPALWKDRQTDMTENIAFPQLCWRIKTKSQHDSWIIFKFPTSNLALQFVSFHRIVLQCRSLFYIFKSKNAEKRLPRVPTPRHINFLWMKFKKCKVYELKSKNCFVKLNEIEMAPSLI